MRFTVPRFFCATATLAAAICGVGFVPTVRVAGESATSAMIAGSVVGLIASWIGMAPMLVGWSPGRRNAASLVLATSALRFLAGMALATAAALSRWWPAGPLLVWVAISYVVLLPVDVAFAIDRMKRME